MNTQPYNPNVPNNLFNQIPSPTVSSSQASSTETDHKSRFEKSTWSQEDDDKLIELKKLGKKIPEIAQKFPERTYNQIADHWRGVLEPQVQGKSLKWNHAETEKLKEVVMPIFQTKGKIDWDEISRRLVTKTARQCSRKWKHMKEKLTKDFLSHTPKKRNNSDATYEEPLTKRQKLETPSNDPNSATDNNQDPILLETMFGEIPVYLSSNQNNGSTATTTSTTSTPSTSESTSSNTTKKNNNSSEQKSSPQKDENYPPHSAPNNSTHSHGSNSQNTTLPSRASGIPSLSDYFFSTYSTPQTAYPTYSPFSGFDLPVAGLNITFSLPIFSNLELTSLKLKLTLLQNLASNFSQLTPQLVNFYHQIQSQVQQENIKFNNFIIIVHSGKCSKNNIDEMNAQIQQIQRLINIYTMILNHYNHYNRNISFAEGPNLYNISFVFFQNLYNNLISGIITPDNFQMQINYTLSGHQYRSLKSTHSILCTNLGYFSIYFSNQYYTCINEISNLYPTILPPENSQTLMKQIQDDINLLNKIYLQLSPIINSMQPLDIENALIQCLRKQITFETFSFLLTQKNNTIKLHKLKFEFLQLAGEDTSKELTTTTMKEIYIKNIKIFHPDKGGSTEVAQKFTDLWKEIKDLLTNFPEEFRF